MPRRRTITRKGYWRQSRSGRRTYVKPARISDRGAPGKGPKLLPKLKSGKLEQFGYDLHETAARRRAAIRRSARRVGYATTIRRVNALRVLLKREPKGKKAKSDVEWMQAHATELGSKTARRRSRTARRRRTR